MQRLNAAGYGHLAAELVETIDDELDQMGLYGDERATMFNRLSRMHILDLLADVAQLRWSGALSRIRALLSALEVPTDAPPSPAERVEEHPPPLILELVADLVVAPLAPPRLRVA